LLFTPTDNDIYYGIVNVVVGDTTQRGGTISPGNNPNELHYEPPADFVGMDKIEYIIRNEAGTVESTATLCFAVGDMGGSGDDQRGWLDRKDEGNGNGYLIRDREPNNYGPIGSLAVDLSFNFVENDDLGAVGTLSFATGKGNKAEGQYTSVFGVDNVATGTASMVCGYNNKTIGRQSFAMGTSARAVGAYSFAGGLKTNAIGGYSLAFGTQVLTGKEASIGVGRHISTASEVASAFGEYVTVDSRYPMTAVGYGNTSSYGRVGGENSPSGTVFEAGIGKLVNGQVERKDGFIVSYAGETIAPSESIQMIDNGPNRILVTKEWVQDNLGGGVGGSGWLDRVDEGNGNGYIIRGREPLNYGPVGENAVDLSYSGEASSVRGATGHYSFASGSNNEASGSNSVALGSNSTAIGKSAVAMGASCTATGSGSISVGARNNSIGAGSASFGQENTAESASSFVAGRGLIANSSRAMSAVGQYNPSSYKDDENGFSWLAFEVGIGTRDDNRKSGLFVAHDGIVVALEESIDTIDNGPNRTLVTKEWVQDNIGGENNGGSGWLEQANTNSYRIKGQDQATHLDIGHHSIDLTLNNSTAQKGGASGNNSLAIGRDAQATMDYSIAIGRIAKAHGPATTVVGSSWAIGTRSLSMGNLSKTEGEDAVSVGGVCRAQGDKSIAIGLHSEARKIDTIAIGDVSVAEGRECISVGKNVYTGSVGNVETGILYIMN